jgi:hypothetical protein
MKISTVSNIYAEFSVFLICSGDDLSIELGMKKISRSGYATVAVPTYCNGIRTRPDLLLSVRLGLRPLLEDYERSC